MINSLKHIRVKCSDRVQSAKRLEKRKDNNLSAFFFFKAIALKRSKGMKHRVSNHNEERSD